MAFARQLVLRVLAALVVPLAIELYVFLEMFPVEAAARRALGPGLLVAEVAFLALVAALAGLLSGPLRRALAEGPGAAPERRAEAAEATLRLPARFAALLGAASAALAVALGVMERRLGAGDDLVAAGVAVAAGFTIMQAALAYSVAASALAPALLALGAPAGPTAGTLRGKTLAMCCSLVAMTALMLGGLGYARYRADTDREALARVRAAQEAAAGWLETRGAGPAAELAAAAGAPTAVVAADGRLLARAGEGAEALAGEPPRGAGVERVARGWRVRRPAGPATLVSFVSEQTLERRRADIFGDCTVLGLLLLGATALLVWLMARSLTTPLRQLGQAAGDIASGDLTVSPPCLSDDEVGRLAADFRGMTGGLAALVRDVQAASGGVQDGTREMGAIGERVRGGARDEHERVMAVHGAVEAMQGSVALVAKGVGGLSDYVHATSAAVSEMSAALEEVRRHAAELEQRVAGAGADAGRLAEAGRRAQDQVGALDAVAGRAQGTMAGVAGSLSGLESSAVGSQLAAAQAAELAEHAGGVVGETVAGMEALRGAVEDAKRRVTALGQRSDDIAQVLDFIGEVAGRTNLLSLNASIIASQAGEHGKAFAVVAEQIRELAAQISTSTKSIARIVGAVRDDVGGTARLIERGDALAARGVAQARRSVEALQDIRAATARGHEAAAGILQAVQAHAHSTRDVSDLVAQAGHSGRALSEALQMIGRSVAAVEAVARGAAGLAENVTRALVEQSGLGRRQLDSLERIDGMLGEIRRAVGVHEAATQRVQEVLGQLTRTAQDQERLVAELGALAERMGGRSRALAQSVDRFKIQ